MRASPAQRSFSAGEISPQLYGRTDYQRNQTGLRKCRGYLPLRQGGVTRAPGTLIKGETHASSKARLISFVFAVGDAVTLEFTNGKMRVWRYGSLVLSGSTPYELAIPYDDDAIARLKWVQDSDAVYFVDGQLPVHRLARYALDNWQIAPAMFDSGPFESEQLDLARTIRASATTGTVTLTGTGDPFSPDHVGALFRLRAIDDDTIPTWTGNTAVAVGERMRYDGNIYEVVSGTNTVVNAPFHLEGDVKTNKAGPVWRFISDRVGIVRITAVANANSATAEVIKTIPPAIVAAPTYRWAEGAFSAKNGYPSCITLFEQRLVLAATPTRPRTIWFSQVGNLEGFDPGVNADDAFAYAITGLTSQNRIVWLQPAARGLHIGALGEEYSTRSSVDGEPIGPTTVAFRRDSTIGSRPAQPISPDGKPIFIARSGDRIFEIRYAFDQDRNNPVELSLPSEHFGALGFEEVHWTAAPLRLGWVRCANGDLVIMQHDPNEDVLGWAVIPLAGGALESIAVSPSEDGRHDAVVLAVRREVNGATKRFIEEVALTYGVIALGRPIEEAVHLFAARSGPMVPASAIVTGLDHLEGEEVYVWSDAGNLGAFTVSGGSVTLPQPVSHYVVGLFDDSHEFETLDIAAATASGDGLGRQKRAKAVGLRLHRTSAAEIQRVEREFGEPDVVSAWQDLFEVAGIRTPLSSNDGVLNIPLPSGYAKEVSYKFRPVGGAPMTPLALAPILDIAGG